MNITNIKNQIKYYKNKYGIKQTIKKCFNKIWMKIKFIFKNIDIYGMDDYHRWIYFNEPTKKEIEEQRKEVFKFQPKISIIVPMYNTPIKFFTELVDNMIGQTYTNWDLHPMLIYLH